MEFFFKKKRIVSIFCSFNKGICSSSSKNRLTYGQDQLHFDKRTIIMSQ